MSEPIRVLQVFASLDRGGAESMIMTLYRNIDRTKVQFDFVVNDNNLPYAFEYEINEMGGRIYRIPRFDILNLINYVICWFRLFNTHKEWKIIHAHHTSPAIVFLLIAKYKGLITLAHSHTAGGKTIKSKLKVISRYPLRFFSDYLFACSVDAAKWMFGRYSKSTIILKNAIDTNVFKFDYNLRNKYRNEFNLSNEFVIGHVGRFDHDKNQSYIIDVFSELLKVYNNTYLILVGDGKLLTEVQNKVNILGLKSNVIFTGIRSDVPYLLSTIDVFVFPSIFEGLPVTIIEAQASGLKCFLSDSITTEVAITDLVEFKSLKQSATEWANSIMPYAYGYERKDMSKQIIEAGYDIKENAHWLQNFYLNAMS